MRQTANQRHNGQKRLGAKAGTFHRNKRLPYVAISRAQGFSAPRRSSSRRSFFSLLHFLSILPRRHKSRGLVSAATLHEARHGHPDSMFFFVKTFDSTLNKRLYQSLAPFPASSFIILRGLSVYTIIVLYAERIFFFTHAFEKRNSV